MERISIFQLFTITVFFQIGTTVIFGFSSSAGRDAWLSTLISMIIGMIIILLYTFLMKMNPGLTLVEWFPAQFGRWVGIPIAWLYPPLYMYGSGRILADLKVLIPTTLLPGSPPWFLILALLIVIVYCLFSGIEVLARFTEYLLPVLFVLLIIEVILLFSSGIVDFKNVQPILGKGWGKVWQAVWPVGITQSFAETLILAMIWPAVKKTEKVKKTTLLATLLAGLIISVFNIMEITVLGEDITQRTTYPLYLLIKQISIADFLENLDALISLNMIITAYIKVTIMLFAAIRSIQLLLNMEDNRPLILPVTAITYLMSMTMSTNIVEHLYADIIFRYYLLIPLIIILPVVLFIVTLIRKRGLKY
ncbi:spore gernimation protein [Priestia megaterium]|uniref:GerAB/ArcD/ProY family transporter n=1 Tax=Priestia megaterium TaxID=1404 RepID=UPI000BFC8838|nr:endospore germination permease [Priestia megaterium]PGN53196.1 spore gernimation protein [Priestia megaterium]PGQ87601.1 spore gernimation protein [Priestia megaterium]